jgi:hypothetical protein
MRSPWQVLRTFASRGKADRASVQPDEPSALSEPSGAVSSEETALLSDAPTPHVPVDVPIEDVEPRQPGHAEIEPNVGVRHEGPADHVAKPVERPASIHALASPHKGELTVSSKKPGQLTQNRLKAPNGRITAAKSQDIAAAPAATALTGHEQATALDLEIQGLRSQLAAKLRIQNSQLKRLLVRYDDQ